MVPLVFSLEDMAFVFSKKNVKFHIFWPQFSSLSVSNELWAGADSCVSAPGSHGAACVHRRRFQDLSAPEPMQWFPHRIMPVFHAVPPEGSKDNSHHLFYSAEISQNSRIWNVNDDKFKILANLGRLMKLSLSEMLFLFIRMLQTCCRVT